ncbi:MAG: PLP-dependent aminotransferase family protein [Parvibaculaceae bacterium]
MATYLELASEFEAAIRSGRLAPGSQLPVQRDLARERSINLSTVSRAYAELKSRNLALGSTKRGTIVMHPRDGAHWPAVPSSAQGVIDLTVNRPAVPDFLAQLQKVLPKLAADPRFRELQEYQQPAGAHWARAAGAKWISLNGFTRPSEDVIVTSGAQHALLAILSALVKPGDVIAADRLTYYGLGALARMFGFEILGIGSDEEGLSATELARACQSRHIKALFTVPVFQNPTVVTMSEKRRREIVRLSDAHGFIIIEDDVYGPMQARRPPAIVTMRPERTFHISALSKALAPGLRVGYLLAPPEHAQRMAEAVQTTEWMPAPLPVLVATKWIEDGTAEAILAAQLAELGQRHRLVKSLLAGERFNADPRCMFIWLHVPAPWRLEDFTAQLLQRGVKVMPASAFVTGRDPVEHAVRVNLACAASQDELAAALAIIATTLKQKPRTVFSQA